MANVVETVERDGHQIAIYESGAEYDLTAGHLVRPPRHALITAENSNDFKRRRQEKSASMLRAAIRREHNAKMTPIANGSAAAFAESGALLYSEIVLNDEAYPRDRMEAWEKLGKYAQVLPSDVRKQDGDGPNPADDPVRALGVLALEYIRTRQQQSAEPTILEQIHETKKDENT